MERGRICIEIIFYEIFAEDGSLLLLYHNAEMSKMTKNSNQGGPALRPWPQYVIPT